MKNKKKIICLLPLLLFISLSNYTKQIKFDFPDEVISTENPIPDNQVVDNETTEDTFVSNDIVEDKNENDIEQDNDLDNDEFIEEQISLPKTDLEKENDFLEATKKLNNKEVFETPDYLGFTCEQRIESDLINDPTITNEVKEILIDSKISYSFLLVKDKDSILIDFTFISPKGQIKFKSLEGKIVRYEDLIDIEFNTEEGIIYLNDIIQEEEQIHSTGFFEFLLKGFLVVATVIVIDLTVAVTSIVPVIGPPIAAVISAAKPFLIAAEVAEFIAIDVEERTTADVNYNHNNKFDMLENHLHDYEFKEAYLKENIKYKCIEESLNTNEALSPFKKLFYNQHVDGRLTDITDYLDDVSNEYYKPTENYFDNYWYGNESFSRMNFLSDDIETEPTITERGCAVIASYNMLTLSGKRYPFSKIIYDIESSGNQLLFGNFGTEPTGINYLLNKYGVKHSTYINNGFDCEYAQALGEVLNIPNEGFEEKIKNMKENDICCLTSINHGGLIKEGAHTYILIKTKYKSVSKIMDKKTNINSKNYLNKKSKLISDSYYTCNFCGGINSGIWCKHPCGNWNHSSYHGHIFGIGGCDHFICSKCDRTCGDFNNPTNQYDSRQWTYHPPVYQPDPDPIPSTPIVENPTVEQVPEWDGDCYIGINSELYKTSKIYQYKSYLDIKNECFRDELVGYFIYA